MITPTLEDKLKYADRCINPDYIIILQNKANEEMDFSQFKVIGLDEKVVISKPLRFIIKATPVLDEEGLVREDKVHLTVYDNFERRTIVDVITKKDKEEIWMTKFREDYSTRNILKMI